MSLNGKLHDCPMDFPISYVKAMEHITSGDAMWGSQGKDDTVDGVELRSPINRCFLLVVSTILLMMQDF